MFVGDSVFQGSLPANNVNEATFVSPRGYTIAGLRALGFTITVVGTGAQANALRNGLPDSACNAQSGATLGPDSTGNNIYTLLGQAATENANPNVIFLQGGTNNLWLPVPTGANGPSSAASEFVGCVARARALFPAAKIIMVGPLPSTAYTSGSSLALRNAAAALDDGVNVFWADPYTTSLLNPTTGADTIDGVHLNVSGSNKTSSNTLVPAFVRMTKSYAPKAGKWFYTRTDHTSDAVVQPPTPTPVPTPAPTPTPTPTPSSIYLKQTIIDRCTQSNSNGWYPSIHAAAFPPWGSNAAGHNGTYYYVDEKIRANDLTMSGDGYSYDSDVGVAIGGGGNRGLNAQYWFINAYPSDRSTGSSLVGVTPWFVIADAYQRRNVATNTRAHARNMKHFVLLTNGTWISVSSDALTKQPVTYGSWYNFWDGIGTGGAGTEDVQNIGTGSGLSDGRIESVDGGSSLGSINQGQAPGPNSNLRFYDTYMWHAFPIGGYTATRDFWQNSVAGTVTTCEARLILHNPAGVDDRATSGLMMNIGEDWFYNNGSGNHWAGGHMHSNWTTLTNNFQLFACSDLTQAQILANPPPGFI